MIETNTQHDGLYPLSEFYSRSEIKLPSFKFVEPGSIPEPYNQLLVHNEDMTSVLQNFHQQKIHLELIELIEEENSVLRRVSLVREDKRIVEFGAIEINMAFFPGAAKKEIGNAFTPLGAILEKYQVEYRSSPKSYFQINSDEKINRSLNLTGSHLLYGRVNQIQNHQDLTLARVVEILPPKDKFEENR